MRRGVVALAVLGVVFFVVPVLSLALDEAAVPAGSDAPALPQGVTVAHDEVQCGSGGCWPELTQDAPGGGSTEDLAAWLGVEPGQEVCRARDLIDQRQVCSGIANPAEGAVVHLRFDRSW